MVLCDKCKKVIMVRSMITKGIVYATCDCGEYYETDFDYFLNELAVMAAGKENKTASYMGLKPKSQR